MCYNLFIGHSLHWPYIKIALQEYVTDNDISQIPNHIDEDTRGSLESLRFHNVDEEGNV